MQGQLLFIVLLIAWVKDGGWGGGGGSSGRFKRDFFFLLFFNPTHKMNLHVAAPVDVISYVFHLA